MFKLPVMVPTAAKLTSLLLLTIVATSACTTMSTSGASDQTGLKSDSQAAAVVMQAGQMEPVYGVQPRSYWLEQRSAKGLMPRLRGSLATGEADAGIDLAKAKLALTPGDPEALLMLASGYALTRNYELAAYYATLLDRAHPGNAAALNIKGLAAMLAPKAHMREYRMAQNLFQQAFAADAQQVAAGLNLGNLQLELGNAGAAAQTFSAVAERCGQCTAGLMGLGVAQSRAREFTKAVATFAVILKKSPQHAPALYNMALVYKNGFNDKKQAENYLFAVLNDSRTKNVALRERAQVVLRMVKGEATNEERTQVTDDSSQDAELLMTGAGSTADDDAP